MDGDYLQAGVWCRDCKVYTALAPQLVGQTALTECPECGSENVTSKWIDLDWIQPQTTKPTKKYPGHIWWQRKKK